MTRQAWRGDAPQRAALHRVRAELRRQWRCLHVVAVLRPTNGDARLAERGDESVTVLRFPGAAAIPNTNISGSSPLILPATANEA
jgi:hypothetical protein